MKIPLSFLRLHPFVSDVSSHHTINNVCVKSVGAGLFGYATDGHSLVRMEAANEFAPVGTTGKIEPMQVLIPPDVCRLLLSARMLADKHKGKARVKNTVEVTSSRSTLESIAVLGGAVLRHVEFHHNKVEGQFPPCDDVIPKENAEIAADLKQIQWGGSIGIFFTLVGRLQRTFNNDLNFSLEITSPKRPMALRSIGAGLPDDLKSVVAVVMPVGLDRVT